MTAILNTSKIRPAIALRQGRQFALTLALSAGLPGFGSSSHGTESPASASAAAEVDAFMQLQMAARHIPGGSIVILSHGAVVLAKNYGLADVEHSVPVTDRTVFEIGSITKQFTATAIMMLVEDGKLTLDDKITTLLDHLPTAWDAITIRHLLNHTSGIPEFAKKLDFRADLRKDYTARQIIALVVDDPLDFAPGQRMSYSNTGYFLLGMIVGKISGKAYGDFLHDRIFQPLDMAATRLNDRQTVIPDRACGYGIADATLLNAERISPSIPFSAGGLVSTAPDMARWALALGSEKLLKAASWDAMWTPGRLNDGQPTAYGFGWYVRSKWSRRRVEHLGGIQGFNGGIAHFIDGDLTVVALFNAEYAHAERFLWGLYGVYLPDTKFKPPAPIADDDPATTKFLREVAAAIAQGMGEPDWFTPAVQQFYFPDRIKARKAMYGAFGPLASFQLVADEATTEGRKRSYRALFGETPFRVAFRLDASGKVSGVDFEPE